MSDSTLQRLFDISYTHVVRQGRPSLDPESKQCMYRSPDGCQCGAGPFIMAYKPEMEGNAFTVVASSCSDCVDPDAVRESRFVRRLQSAHDNSAGAPLFLDDYRSRMQLIANQYGLAVPEL